jgi:hypothetical protein
VKREREREKRRKCGDSETHYNGGGTTEKIIFPVFKVPRQSPLFLLV